MQFGCLSFNFSIILKYWVACGLSYFCVFTCTCNLEEGETNTRKLKNNSELQVKITLMTPWTELLEASMVEI